MPYVRIEITEGASRDQKRGLIADVTSSLVQRLGKRPEHIHIVIDDVAEQNWGFAGMPTDEWRMAEQEAANAESSQ